MAKRVRDERSKLIDNIGRQIRRLNAREKTGDLDPYQMRGLQRQRENLKQFREEVKKIDKTDKTGLKKAKEDYKNNGNYSTSQKKIDQNTKRLTATELIGEETLSELPGGAEPGSAGESKPEAEPSEPEDYGGDGDGGTNLMDQMDDLFADMAEIEGKYIGAYASPEVKDQVAKIIDKAKTIQGDEINVDDDTRSRLNALIVELERASQDTKGNFSVRDTAGKVIGYNNTFNAKKYMENTAPVNFDVNKWILENASLFPNVQAKPGGQATKLEKWESQNSGLFGDWDY